MLQMHVERRTSWPCLSLHLIGADSPCTEEPGRRVAAWSLLMVAGTAVALLLAGVAGTFLQLVVFDLDEQESIGHAGAWGYVAGFFLLALMALPALAGIVLGVRARRVGERRRGTTGVLVNALIAACLVIPGVANILSG
jgi:MFS family permease